MMNMKKLNTILIVGIILLSTVLLVGRLFNATWAGGDGYDEQGVAIVDEVEYQRGEIIETSEDEWIEVSILDNTVWLYENTQLKLINLTDDNVELTVIQGRVVIYGRVNMRIREEVTLLDGLYSYVHYSWLDETDVQYINDDFDYAESEAADFYEWVLY